MKILIVSHDAGGAEIISSWALHHPENEYAYLLEGPAQSIFVKKFSHQIFIHLKDDLENLINEHELIITGTSGDANLERIAINLAKKNNKKIISYLDHWCEFKERFQDGEDLFLPDELWVADEYAFALAKTCFPSIPISLVGNYYLSDFKEKIFAYPATIKESGLKILYICEPIAEYALQKYQDKHYFNYTEYEALTYFFSIISTSNYKNSVNKIRLRLHPLEKANKYSCILEDISLPLEIVNTSLIEDIVWADWVVGCSSMALIQALVVNKIVYTCVPIGAKIFKFPHQEIQSLPTHIEEDALFNE